MKVEGKVALVTGGGDGIGKGVVKYLLESNAKFVAILDWDASTSETTCSEFSSMYGADRVCFVQCDVSKEDQLKDAFEKVYSKYKQLDIVVNNAGILGEEEHLYDQTLNIDLRAVIKGTYLAKKYMSKSKGGSGGVVVNTASVAGLYPFGFPVYGAAKHGVIGFTRNLPMTDEAFGNEIRIGCICPGYVSTKTVNPHLKVYPDSRPLNPIPVEMIAEGYKMFIEDDSLNGSVIKVTHGTGVALHQYPSSEEMDNELKLHKE